jgi:transposase
MSRMEKTLSSQQATDWREGRRLRAWELKQEGWKQRDIARALGVSKGAVSQWMKRAKQEGMEALKHRPPPGAKARLSEDERNFPSFWHEEHLLMASGESFGRVREWPR